ncbi:MAG TPA: universal stress protein [Streptosporangiaceae bacterium]|nr:universal stress protein [Streptosporangiaceae bacterium]
MTYRIVVGIDSSPHSIAALHWALRHAERLSGEVLALFCWQMPFYGVPGGFNRDELEERAKALLRQTVAVAAPDPSVPLLTVVAEGDPTEALIEASKNANLLVVGTRGRSQFAGLMLGSVSQGCSAHAYCPVVLVKKSDDPAGAGGSGGSPPGGRSGGSSPRASTAPG